ncbi:hypothetical protein OIDMADRAFT_21131 [Oidiodendron maius Zn]|uniref:Uncharacterized protein n=1 Tax=Oidiodendron maius (strain Zn) TaxID=913774 RepID=A0A0C3GGU9_OIDMZ|nr:hypothetical protein OIDMADRAFT_21131 [Oidiodendron maius Zn]
MWKPFESWHMEGSESRVMFKLEHSILDTLQANFQSKLLILAIIVRLAYSRHVVAWLRRI